MKNQENELEKLIMEIFKNAKSWKNYEKWKYTITK